MSPAVSQENTSWEISKDVGWSVDGTIATLKQPGETTKDPMNVLISLNAGISTTVTVKEDAVLSAQITILVG